MTNVLSRDIYQKRFDQLSPDQAESIVTWWALRLIEQDEIDEAMKR